MLYEHVDSKTLSDRYANSRMVPFLTHIDGVRENLFSINPRQKMTTTMVNQVFFLFFFFTVKLDATNPFPSNTAEVRLIYLKLCHIMRKPVFAILEQQKRRSACAPRSLISAFVVRSLDSNEILQLKAMLLDWHIHCVVCGKRLVVTCTFV